jgi:hypothetical protein
VNREPTQESDVDSAADASRDGRSPSATSRWALAAALGGGLICLAPTLAYGFGFDHGVVQYMAWAWLRGQWPLVDVWDTTFPGGVLVHMATLQFGGSSALPLRALDLAIQSCVVVLLFRIASRALDERAGLLAALLYATTYSAGGFYHTAQRDAFAVPLLLLALSTLFSYLDSARTRWVVVAGGAIGLSCLIKPTFALFVPAAVVPVLLMSSKARRKARVSDAAALAAAASLPGVVLLAVYAHRGLDSALWEAMVWLRSVYTHLETASPFRVAGTLLETTPAIAWIGVLLSPFALGRKHAILLFGFLATCAAMRFIEAKAYRYHYWPIVACTCMAGAVGWAHCIDRVTGGLSSGRRLLRAGLLTVVAVWSPLFSGEFPRSAYGTLASDVLRASSEERSYSGLVANDPPQADLARYLHETTERGDCLVLWGPKVNVYYAAERLSCTPEMPVAIVAHYEEDSLRVAAGSCFAPDFPQLRAIIDADYERDRSFGVWTVFRRRQ